MYAYYLLTLFYYIELLVAVLWWAGTIAMSKECQNI